MIIKFSSLKLTSEKRRCTISYKNLCRSRLCCFSILRIDGIGQKKKNKDGYDGYWDEIQPSGGEERCM
jgi:hypothetical protein